MDAPLDQIGSKEAAGILRLDRTGVIRLVGSGSLKPDLKLPGARGAYVFNRATVEELAKTRAESGGDAA